ncbi:hypothetical protein OIV83_000425 [Microbotryomycetes sp. JL201]|nr:hypothetical protein OIV83_000425 [Microbotryomycetes sp. JL201]
MLLVNCWRLLLASSILGPAIAQHIAQQHHHRDKASIDRHQHEDTHFDKDKSDPHVLRVIRETIVLGANGQSGEPTSATTAQIARHTVATRSKSIQKADSEPANVLTTLGKLRALQPLIVFAVHHPLRFAMFVLRSLPPVLVSSLRFAGRAFWILFGPVSWLVSWSLGPFWRFYDMLASLSTLWTFLGLAVFVGASMGIIVAAVSDMAPRDWFSLVGSSAPRTTYVATSDKIRPSNVVEPNRVEAVWERTKTGRHGHDRRYSATKPVVPSSMVSDHDSESDATETDSEGPHHPRVSSSSFGYRSSFNSDLKPARDPIEAWMSTSSSKGGSSSKTLLTSSASSTGMSRAGSGMSDSTRSRYSSAYDRR